ncbi:MAG TPA: copper-binding protein, partial [Vicinamibacterales bacterium]|nr:copper-binding protein [Vicinamibacterales bacterium]
VKARIEVANPGGKLVPGMFATIGISPATSSQTLLVPSEAVIQTGKRSVVIRAEEGGKFRPVEVEIGVESQGQTEIRKGLDAGQRIVVSGQFLLDSESSLKASINRMGEDPAGGGQQADPGQAAGSVHRGTGKIEALAKDNVTLSHGPIPSLKWGPMTMGFEVPQGVLPPNLKVGDTVNFEVRPTKDGAYEVTSMTAANAGAAK